MAAPRSRSDPEPGTSSRSDAAAAVAAPQSDSDAGARPHLHPDGLQHVHPETFEPHSHEPPRGALPHEAVRVSALSDGAILEWTGEEGMAALAPGEPADPTRPEASVWVDLTEPDQAFVQRIGEILHLHPLLAEDIVEGNQRGKIEVTDGVVHIVLFVLGYDSETVAQEVDLVLGKGFVLSAHPAGWDPRASSRVQSGLEPMLKPGPDHVLWALFDEIVDGYFPFADRLAEVVDRLQDLVIDRPDRRTLEELFALKRDLIAVRRAVSPVREILNQLTNRELALIDAEELVYFRDIYDHVIRLTDELDTDRELVAATVEIYLSTINNNLSTIMKRLTGVTVILAGAGAIAGVFGMSEAGLAFSGAEAAGFWMVTILIVGITAVAAVILHKIDWI
jgi:magnesium transporter